MSRPTQQMQRQLNQSNQNAQSQGINLPELIKAYYAYNLIPSASIASGASASANFTVQSDSYFLAQALSFFCWDSTAGSAITAPYTTVQITVTSSGTTFFDQAMPISSVFGTGQYPFIMPEPRNLPPNSNITATINNVSSTNAQLYWLTIHGKKLFNYQP